MTRILCVGSAVVDFIFSFDELPERAEKYVAKSAEIVGGGIAANAAVAIARLGGQACLAAQLGDDATSELVLKDLRAEGVDLSLITQTEKARSSYSSVYVNAAGERQIANYRGEGLHFDIAKLDAAPKCNAVLVDTRLPTAAIAALKLAKSQNVPGIVDGEAPIDKAILAEASHVAFSMQGIKSLYPNVTPAEAVQLAASEYQIWAAVTDGQIGVWFSDAGVVSHVPAFTVPVVDTLGAGDVWHGAFALALAEGQTEIESVKFANAVAALKCTQPGGRAGSPTRAELDNFLKGRV